VLKTNNRIWFYVKWELYCKFCPLTGHKSSERE